MSVRESHVSQWSVGEEPDGCAFENRPGVEWVGSNRSFFASVLISSLAPVPSAA